VANGEGDTEAGTRGAEEDPARWVVFVTPRVTTLALLPWQLRVGDHVVGAKGEWEVVGGPARWRHQTGDTSRRRQFI